MKGTSANAVTAVVLRRGIKPLPLSPTFGEVSGLRRAKSKALALPCQPEAGF
ncbi:MAG: hypothetical protein LBT78_06960 [Tannerella sp.]|nr:hypothetical protein [Tannerella sp.]